MPCSLPADLAGCIAPETTELTHSNEAAAQKKNHATGSAGQGMPSDDGGIEILVGSGTARKKKLYVPSKNPEPFQETPTVLGNLLVVLAVDG